MGLGLNMSSIFFISLLIHELKWHIFFPLLSFFGSASVLAMLLNVIIAQWVQNSVFLGIFHFVCKAILNFQLYSN